MKILLINNLVDFYGGQEIVVDMLIDGFRRNHQVVILAGLVSAEAINKYPEVKFYQTIKKLKAEENINTFDALHFHNPSHFFTFKALLNLRHKNKIATIHRKRWSPNWFKNIFERFWDRLVFMVIPLFLRKFIFLTRFDQNFFSRQMLLKRLSMVFGNAVEKDFLGEPRNLPVNRRSRLLFVGRLRVSKGIRELLAAAELMPEFDFWLVGLGKRPENTPNNVLFLGSKNRQAIKEIYQQADIFILPSYLEGLPIVLLEAMAAGLPVVATNIVGLGELIEDQINGKLIPVRDSVAIREAVVWLMTDRRRFEIISMNNIKKIKRDFFKEDFIKRHLDFYAV